MKCDAVKVVIVDAEEKVLVLRRSGTHPHYPHFPDFPGGDVDAGESLEEALVREIREETGLEVSIDELQHMSSWQNHYGTLHHAYILSLAEPNPEVAISWEHDQHEWKPIATLLQEDFLSVSDKYYVNIVRCLDSELTGLRST